ncbi:MAG: hypothetical protein HQL53_04860 [Magnetococcales bacterium]|nr:hypothetical protein [Magnetococcales bacterium]
MEQHIPTQRGFLKNKTLSISVTLALAISLLVAVIGGTLLAISMDASKESTGQLLEKLTVTLSNRLEGDLHRHMERLENDLLGLSHRVAMGDLDLDDQARVQEVFSGFLTAMSSVMGVVASRDGRHFYGVARTSEGGLAAKTFDTDSDDVVTSTLPRRLFGARAQWGEVTLRDGRAMVVRHQPVINGTQVLGSMMLAVDVRDLSRMIARIGLEVGGSGFILQGRDRVLAHGLRAEEGAESGLTVSRVTLGDAVLAGIWDGRMPPPLRELAKSVQADLRHVKIEERNYLAVMRPMTGYGPKPWIVGVWMPAEVLGVDAIRRILWAGVVAVLVLILGVSEAVVLGRRIARPIVQATTILGQVRNLDLDQVRPLPQSFFRELNDQAITFNTMLQGLRAFERYVPKRLVHNLMKNHGDACTLESLIETREVTIMFTDLAGYTTFTEGMEPQEVAAFLNHHFEILGHCVESEGGTIDKYIGDALMAFWGAPTEMEDAPARACRAALAIADKWGAHNRQRVAAGEQPVRMRMGIHTGPVVVGNIGYSGRVNYTIVGDAVNSCQRLEALGKEVDPEANALVLISDAVRGQLDEAVFPVISVGRCPVKGRRRPMEVFRLGQSREP